MEDSHRVRCPTYDVRYPIGEQLSNREFNSPLENCSPIGYRTSYVGHKTRCESSISISSSLQRYEGVARVENDTSVEKMALRFLNKRNTELAAKWLPTAMTYGAGATLMMLYMTDWKLVLQHVPFYGSKFNEE